MYCCFSIKRFAAPAGIWTAIVAPIGCNYFSLSASLGQNVAIRTDDTDSTTEDTLTPGFSENVTSTHRPTLTDRYPKGATICYVNPSGPEVIIGRFVL